MPRFPHVFPPLCWGWGFFQVPAPADPDDVPPARAVCVPAFDEDGRVMAVLQVARCGGDPFQLTDVSILQHVAFGVSVTLHRLSELAASHEARKEANAALAVAKEELSDAATKVWRASVAVDDAVLRLTLDSRRCAVFRCVVQLSDMAQVADALTQEVEELRHANTHLGSLVDSTRSQAKDTQAELVTQNQSHQAYIDELELKISKAVTVKEKARSLNAKVLRLEAQVEQKTKLLDSATSEIEELQLQVRDSIANSASMDAMEQLKHDKRLLQASLSRTKEDIARVQEDCVFLAGAVKEMVAHSGRIGRTRLNEALRICSRVSASSGDRSVSSHGRGHGHSRSLSRSRVGAESAMRTPSRSRRSGRSVSPGRRAGATPSSASHRSRRGDTTSATFGRTAAAELEM